MTTMQQRRGTAAQWTSANPILAEGEIGFETDTNKFKFGDGITAWSSLLPYHYGDAQLIQTYVKNNTGSTLNKGQAVYISGATGSNVLISLASASSEATSSKTLGLLAQQLTTGSSGYVITNGTLVGVDTSAWTEGTALWLDTTAGGITSTKAVAPNHLVYIGVVTRQHAIVGEILVKIQNGYEIDELHDVKITSVATGDVLVRTSNNIWENKTLANANIAGLTGATFSGDVTLQSGVNLTVGGNLTVSGTTTTINTTDLAVKDSLIYLATGNTSTDLLDIGFLGSYGSSGEKHAGLLRKNTNGGWFLFTGLATEPTSGTYDLTGATYDALTIGALTASSTTLSGNMNIGTGKFTVAASSGNTVIGGTLSLGSTSDITVNTNKFIVTASSGNTTIAGTLGVTGVTTLTGLLAANGGISGAASKNMTVASTYANGTLSTTGTIGTVAGTGPYTATITGMSATNGFYVGQVITATAGTGSFGAGTMTVASIVSTTSITVSSTATFTAGTVTNISTTSNFGGQNQKVIMTAAATGLNAPTTRPDGTALQAGDIWISW